MQGLMPPKPPKLSICIPTYNRARFLSETLESIVSQASTDCEVVVLDGGSSDNTADIASRYQREFSGLRYVVQEERNGLDRAYDESVKLARGEYCWVVTSKDLLKPGAIAAVLRLIREDISLVALNMEIRDLTL